MGVRGARGLWNCVAMEQSGYIREFQKIRKGRTMTLTQLRYIIAIADTGSMIEAAKSLFISQPSLSLAVKELEKEIGTRLFKRSNRGVSVTQEGMEFLSYARQVV